MHTSEILQLTVAILAASRCSSQSTGDSQLYGPWSCVFCNNTQYNNQFLTGKERWDIASASQAWKAITDTWGSYRNQPKPLNFSAYVATILGDGEDIQCSTLGPGSNCMTDNNCISSPAYDSIYRSFVWLNNFHYTLWQGTQNAISTNVALLLPDFSSQFALQLPQIKSGFESNLAWIDFIALGAAVMSAGTFNLLLPELGLEVGALLTMEKDTVTPALVQTANLVKDTLKKAADGNVFNSEAELSGVVGVVTYAWTNGTATQIQNLFNGSDSSNTALFNFISDGKLFASPYTDLNQVENFAKIVTFGYLVPAAWQLSNQNIVPVVLDGGSACSQASFFDSQIESRVCWNDHAYFLLDCATAMYRNPFGDYEAIVVLQALPGIDELQKGTYGITSQDIVAGVTNSYNQNGNKNGWPQMDVTDSNTIYSLLTGTSGGVRSPGFFSIPFYDSSTIGTCNNH